MSDLSRDTTIKAARLARIQLSEEEINQITPKLQGIMTIVDTLQEVDTDGVAPMASPVGDNSVTLRADEVTDGNCQDKVLGNAKESTQGFYTVPKVVE